MPKTATLTPQIATAPTYGREPFIVATATPPAATVPTAGRVVAAILGRSSLAGMCGSFRPEEGRKPGTGTFCILDHGHTEDHRSGIFYSWPLLADAEAAA